MKEGFGGLPSQPDYSLLPYPANVSTIDGCYIFVADIARVHCQI